METKSEEEEIIVEKKSKGFFGWIFSFIRGILYSLGLSDMEANMVFLGLDNAGKTTLLGTIGTGKVKSFKPTRYPQCEELVLGSINFKTWDLGGHELARSLWVDYITDVDVIVFVVDASDPERFPEARKELAELLKTITISQVPFLILGNKIDKTNAVGESVLREALGLTVGYTTGKDYRVLDHGIRPIELFMCSVIERFGYPEGFKWVSKYIKPK